MDVTLGIINPTDTMINSALRNCLSFIFHAFKAGIADAISNFKWRKIIQFLSNRHLQELNYFTINRRFSWPSWAYMCTKGG